MSDERINHYYPAGIMAWGFSKNKLNPLRKSKVTVINVPKFINLLTDSVNNQITDVDKFINDNKHSLLEEKIAEDIFIF